MPLCRISIELISYYMNTTTLKSCYISSLDIAVQKSLHALACPLLGTGARGVPKDKAVCAAVSAIHVSLFMYSMHTIHITHTLPPIHTIHTMHTIPLIHPLYTPCTPLFYRSRPCPITKRYLCHWYSDSV
jgi:hypothetical protein